MVKPPISSELNDAPVGYGLWPSQNVSRQHEDGRWGGEGALEVDPARGGFAAQYGRAAKLRFHCSATIAVEQYASKGRKNNVGSQAQSCSNTTGV